MARPRANIDAAEVEKLASFGCNNSEIASLVGASESTIRARFRENLTKGRNSLRKSLRRKQVEMALSGDRTMLIWLGKQYLDQAEKQEQDNKHSGAITIRIVRASERRSNDQ